MAQGVENVIKKQYNVAYRTLTVDKMVNDLVYYHFILCY